MSEIKLIAFDLDDTLFNSNKDISQANMDALERAAKMGIELVPTTGRFWSIVHEKLRNSGLIHYAITLNGAEIFDVRQNKSIAKFKGAVSSVFSCFLYSNEIFIFLFPEIKSAR